MSSFFSYFFSKPKTEEVMATTSLTSDEESTTPPVTEDSRSEPQSPVNLLSPSSITQPQSSQLDSQPKSPKEQDQPSNSYTDDEILLYIAENNELKPPFTIQRLSELIIKPYQHHKTLIKWLRAVEKVLTVQSSMDMYPSITNTITLTDKLELMEVTSSPKLVPISFAYNAEEIEKENANSPKLVPIKFAYNAGLEVVQGYFEKNEE
ncbi:18071_t:CDS:2 [Funneliformis geosporum]|nr:18071_t:CDS:2 [Funneliformis geosporum]